MPFVESRTAFRTPSCSQTCSKTRTVDPIQSAISLHRIDAARDTQVLDPVRSTVRFQIDCTNRGLIAFHLESWTPVGTEVPVRCASQCYLLIRSFGQPPARYRCGMGRLIDRIHVSNVLLHEKWGGVCRSPRLAHTALLAALSHPCSVSCGMRSLSVGASVVGVEND